MAAPQAARCSPSATLTRSRHPGCGVPGARPCLGARSRWDVGWEHAHRLPQTPAPAVQAAAGTPVQKHTLLAFAEPFFSLL